MGVEGEAMPDYVCSACFEDEDLSAWISRNGEHQRCDFCGRIDAPAVEFKGVCDFITACIQKYSGRAVDQMPYGGSAGIHVIPRQNGLNSLSLHGKSQILPTST